MLRTVLVLVAIVAGCGGGGGSPAAPPGDGPAFSPAIANQLRAIAPNCKFERVNAAASRTCTGIHGKVQIALQQERFTTLVIEMPSKILSEAKTHFGNALRGVFDAAGLESVIVAMSKLETGARTDLTIGSAKVGLAAGGTSRIAPAYSIEVTWN